MARYVLSPLAAADLQLIYDYTLDQWGEAQAERYLAALRDRFRWLITHPDIGKQRNDIGWGLRSFPEGKHLIFYRVAGKNIEVAAVPHQREDPASYLS